MKVELSNILLKNIWNLKRFIVIKTCCKVEEPVAEELNITMKQTEVEKLYQLHLYQILKMFLQLR